MITQPISKADRSLLGCSGSAFQVACFKTLTSSIRDIIITNLTTNSSEFNIKMFHVFILFPIALFVFFFLYFI